MPPGLGNQILVRTEHRSVCSPLIPFGGVYHSDVLRTELTLDGFSFYVCQLCGSGIKVWLCVK